MKLAQNLPVDVERPARAGYELIFGVGSQNPDKPCAGKTLIVEGNQIQPSS